VLVGGLLRYQGLPKIRGATAINATRATMIIISVKPMPVGLPGYPIIADKRIRTLDF
jgi:hypothetical protein